jgi:hypothetical protein
MYTISRLPIDQFDWLTWLSGTDIYRKFDFYPTKYSFIDYADTIKKYAVGYIHGSRLFCRPVENEIAVMFLVDDVFGWTHFREEEFEEVFRVR